MTLLDSDTLPARDVRRIAPSSGVAFTMQPGQTLHVIDPFGGQVSDLMAFVIGDDGRATPEVLSSGRSIDYNNNLYLTTGHTLWTNRSRKMFDIIRDDAGRHDFTLTPCSSEMYQILCGDDGSHPSCFSNLRDSLAPAGVLPDQIPTTFNLFMNVTFDANTGAMTIGPPTSKAGDRISLRALLPVVVGLTACASETTNAGSLGPIDYAVTD